ncbi:hypothetical protein V5O48_000311 [Marasmius crinis-equi]|uniref:Uncharacterized protein n=1 Tax=Marasmius crinis-equi TaxID=585013 RepID=A0ABR3G1Q3_9AGAR
MVAILSTPLTPTRRIIIALVAAVICLHGVLSVVFENYHPLPGTHYFTDSQSVSVSVQDLSLNVSHSSLPSYNVLLNSTDHRANATFVLLCRNNDLNGVAASMQSVEDRFNRHYNYPWVLLNEEPFTDEFKERVSVITRAQVSFGLIPKEHWYQPDWIDEDRAKKGREKMMRQGIIYGGSVSYRNMCRFNSGFFFQHELLQPYRYYWRVEPDVKFFCDVSYDPFRYMEEHNKIYGFTIALVEWEATIPTLWNTVKEFIKENPQYVDAHNAMGFLTDNGGEKYNLCHFWSNFEIADMDFWRGEAYQAFFNYLDSKGGFYYEVSHYLNFVPFVPSDASTAFTHYHSDGEMHQYIQ